MPEELELHALETEWRHRFGEPLPMRTDPDLIRRVLHDLETGEARSFAPPG